MDKPLSRICRDRIGRFFHALGFEQEHTEACQSRSSILMNRHAGCRLIGTQPPIALHAVWINDLCHRDPAAPVFLHYADDHATEAVFAKERSRRPGEYLGVWPYVQVEFDFEVVRDGQVMSHLHPRFRIEELKDPFPREFLDVARELHLMPHSLFDIVRLHADPRVELALPPSTASPAPPPQ